MIKIENIQVFNFEGAIRGMRNPLNSWNKSDSKNVPYSLDENCYTEVFELGKNDLDLMQRLYKAGHPHRKYLRQIFVSMDITAPLYWWKETDQYRVGVTTNSCSTMHKIHSKDLTLDDFSTDHLTEFSKDALSKLLDTINYYREDFVENKTNKDAWWQMIQLLPSSYNQRRTLTCNYENIVNMLEYRSDHKLDEWQEFCQIMLDKLPYLKEILNGSNE